MAAATQSTSCWQQVISAVSARELQGWSRQCRGPGLQLKGKGDGQGWGPHNPLTSPALGPSAFALHTHTCARACAQTGKHTQFSISPSPQGPSSSPSFLSKPPNSFQNSGFEGQRVSPAAPYTLLLRRWAIPGCDSLGLRLPTLTVGMSCHTLPPGHLKEAPMCHR